MKHLMCAGLTGVIYLTSAKQLKNGVWVATGNNKIDMTDEARNAVFVHLEYEAEEHGGAIVVTSPNSDYELIMRKRADLNPKTDEE